MRSQPDGDSGIADANHAFLYGNLIQCVNQGLTAIVSETRVEVETDENGNYLPFFYIHRPSGKYKVSVEKEEA